MKNSVFQFVESCGLGHSPQVVEVPLAAELPDAFLLQTQDGRLFPGQRSASNSGFGFLKVAIQPFENFVLTLAQDAVHQEEPRVSFRMAQNGKAVLSNGLFSLEVFVGVSKGAKSGFAVPGPVCRVKIREGAWRGRTFIDSRFVVTNVTGEIVERGPVRGIYRYRVDFDSEGFYQATVTVDDGQPFATVDEEFRTGSGDQVVWDFAGDDLPDEFYLLDSSAAFHTRSLAYHMDVRLARLAAWTQQSQHLDLVDGFAFRFGNSSEIAGFVALEGGNWRGDKLNHLEAWGRRWLPGDPASRRDIPASAKADSYPGTERVPARGGVVCEEHFNVEGWVCNGRRKFALVLAERRAIEPENAFSEPPLQHFELTPDRDRYRRQQSLLRRIHIQWGVMPLKDILQLDFSWPEEAAPGAGVTGFHYPNVFLEPHFQHLAQTGEAPRAAAIALLEYLSARVYGFWEGSGLAYTNPVISRRIAPELFHYEWLLRQDVFTLDERRLVRALFAFLIHLFASENCYTGDAAMLPAESPDSTEPTLQGMANQNFYTDVINLLGAGAQVFFAHPKAATWRSRFGEQWRRQLAFHVYPESGLWEESHTYYQHVLHTVLPTLLRRRADGVEDEFRTEAFQKVVRSALKQITPRDTCFGNRRYVLAFGDHEPAPNPKLFQNLALAFADADLKLSRQLLWAAREMGFEEANGLEVEAPSLRSEYVQGLGIMFRSTEDSSGESLLALRSGLAWGHHHNDDGSIQFFARGRALVVDSCFSMNQSGGLKVEAAGHSRWSLRDAQPVNYFWRFNRGWVTGFNLNDRFPWASSFSPVYTVRGSCSQSESLVFPSLHWRTVVQLNATTYLITDSSRCEQPQVVRFHIAGHGVARRGNQTVYDFPGGRLTLAPLFASAALRLGVNHPDGKESPGEFTTTCACYDVSGSSFAAFLLRAGDPGDSVEVIQNPASCTIRSSDMDVTIRRERNAQDDLLFITDHRSDQTSSIELHTDVTK